MKQESKQDTVAGNSNWFITLVVPLWLIYVSNQWARSSIYYLVDFSKEATPESAMNVALDFTEAQYGLLASVAFTALFATASLGAGVASDRYNRKTLSWASAALWSAAVLGTSLSTSYEQVLACRVVMGLACAFSTPTAYTLIQERVPPDSNSFASSLYGTGVALGGALASLSILLDTRLGWREATFVIAMFGFAVVALSILALPDDPKEQGTEGETTPSKDDDDTTKQATDGGDIWQEFSQVLETSRVRWLFLASFLRFSAGLTIGVWCAPYFRLAFSDHQSEYAVAQALIGAGCGVASGVLGGLVADRVAGSADAGTSDIAATKLWAVPVVGTVLAVPTWYLAMNSGDDSFYTAVIWLAVEYLVAESWFGPTVSVLQTTVSPKIGGTAQGMFTLTGAIGNLAPSALGFLYEGGAQESSEELAQLLSFAVCGCYMASAACFALAAQSPAPLKAKTD